MTYTAPYIDDAGLHLPTYNDVRDDLVNTFKQIYGQDIYLDNDSQDYQLISAFALKTYDTMQLLQIIYNNHSPKTAVGSGLDGLVKLNGIKRKSASYSTCVVTITGDVGTVITNGQAEDDVGYKWELPTSVKLTDKQQAVTAQCTTLGAIEALPGSISKIATPTKGWLAVTNEVAAVTGASVETSEELRQRQSISVANPSRNMLNGTIGGIASVSGVKRYKVYENDSNVTDENGIPGHSIAAVVEGGLDADVGEVIYLRKGPGCGTYGTTSVDYENDDGLTTKIRFFRPEYVSINVKLSIRKMTSYTTATKAAMQEKIESYISGLNIGCDVTITGILASVLSMLSDVSNPEFALIGLTVGTGENMYSADIPIAFQSVAAVGTITIEEE